MSYSSDEEENRGSCGCGNAICQNEIGDKQIDAYVTCSLCLQPTYCSEACRAIDWVKHDCPNCLIVPEKTQNMMVPYYFEDMLPQQVLSSLEPTDPIFQSYAFVHHGTDQTVTQWIQPPLIGADSNQYAIGGVEVDSKIARGSDPRDKDIGLKGTYGITITAFDNDRTNPEAVIDIAGTIPHDMIFAKNPSNKVASALAGDLNKGSILAGLRNLRSKFVKDTQSVVFWPVVGKTEPISQYGNLEIELQVDGTSIGVTTGYDLTEDAARAGTGSRISKGVKKYFEQRLKTKFPGKEAAIKYMITRHLLTPEGTQIAITFRVLPREKTATIVDIEILVQTSQLAKSKKKAPFNDNTMDVLNSNSPISVPIDCDPKNMSQVTGLIMALEMHMQDGENKHLADNAGIIRKYGRSLLDAQGKAPEVVPMEVNAAIHTVVNDLSEIGAFSQFRNAFFSQGSTRKFAKKNKNDYQALKRRFEALVRKIQASTGHDNKQLYENAKWLRDFINENHPEEDDVDPQNLLTTAYNANADTKVKKVSKSRFGKKN